MERQTHSWSFAQLFSTKRFLVFNLAFFVLVGWGFSGEYSRNSAMQKEIDRLQTRADTLVVKNKELREQEKNTEAIGTLEHDARLKLNLQKPGEEVVIVRTAPIVNKTETDSIREKNQSESAVSQESHLQKWWYYFFR